MRYVARYLLVLSGLLWISGCTPFEQIIGAGSAEVTLSLPTIDELNYGASLGAQSLKLNSSSGTGVHTLSFSKKVNSFAASGPFEAYGLVAPTDLSEIVCFAVAVEWPENAASSTNTCQDSGGLNRFIPGLFKGLYKAGQEVSLTVPAGSNRKVYLLGFAAASEDLCVDFFAANGPPRSLLSAPVILGQIESSLSKGRQALAITPSLAGAIAIDDCSGDIFEAEIPNPTLAAAPDIVAVYPSNLSPAGGQTIAVFGVGFQSGLTVNIDASSCGSVTVASATSAFCISPAHAAGSAVLSLTNTSGLSTTFPVTYAAPIIKVYNAQANEGDPGAVLVSLSAPALSNVVLTYATVAGTAIGADFIAASGIATIATGTSSTLISVATVEDASDENNEAFHIDVSLVSSSASLFDRRGSVFILDDDLAPFIFVSDAAATEAQTLAFVVSLSVASGRDVYFNFQTISGTAAPGLDFVITNNLVSIAAGVGAITVKMVLIDDTLVESTETLTVSLASLTNALAGDVTGVGTITDNDAAPVPGITIYDVSATEGQTLAFKVSLSSPSSSVVTFNYASAGGSATSGTDFTAVSGSGSITAGTSSVLIYVLSTQDLSVEGSEAFTVSLSSIINTVVADIVATGTIVDDDSSPNLVIYDSSVTEGQTLFFKISLSSVTSLPVSVSYATTGGTAASGSDYLAAAGTLTIAAGSLSATVAVATIDDVIVESSEGMTVSLSAVVNAMLVDSSGAGTITDNDSASPAVYISDSSAAEGGTLQFTISLSSASASAVFFSWNTNAGTATSSTDFVPQSGGVSLAPGVTLIFVDVPTVQDVLSESSETFTLVLSSLSGATAGDLTGLGTIIDDDSSPPNLFIYDASVTEGGSLAFKISLSAVSAFDISFSFTTEIGAASAADFTTAFGSKTIPAGMSSTTIVVFTADDAVVEPSETMIVTLSSFVNANVMDGIATGTINDNDSVWPGVAIYDSTVTEGSTLVFLVSLNSVPTTPVSLDYFATDVTANEFAGDYSQGAGNLSMPAGQTMAYISIPTNQDIVVEGVETFSLGLTIITGATFVDGTALGTINDDDSQSSNLVLQTYFKSPVPDVGDYYGQAFSQWGNHLAVGAPYEDSSVTGITYGAGASANNASLNSGAVYLYSRVGTTWSSLAFIKAPNSETGDNFSEVSLDGDVMAIGTIGEDSSSTAVVNGGGTIAPNNAATDAGAVYVYRKGTSWTFEAYLKPSNAGVNDKFGYDVDVSGDLIAVSATGEDSSQTVISNGTLASSNNALADSGAVYLFKYTSGTWMQSAYIKAANAGAADSFGESVALDHETLVVGASNESSSYSGVQNGTGVVSNDSALNSGAVYVYRFSASTWSQEAFLKSASPVTADYFGFPIAIAGESIAVGCIGDRNVGTVVVNGTGMSNAGLGSGGVGSVYVFRRSTNSWQQEAYVQAPVATNLAYFGQSVSLFGDTLAVGSFQENSSSINAASTASTDQGALASGAVFVFKRSGSSWVFNDYLKAASVNTGDNCGVEAQTEGDNILFSCPRESNSSEGIQHGSVNVSGYLGESGAVYHYRRTGESFTVVVRQTKGQTDPALSQPIKFEVEFGQEINAATFTASDIVQAGTATGVTWSITSLGDDRHFTLSATAGSAGTYVPQISAGTVTSVDGQTNKASSPNFDNSVSY